MFWKEGKVFSKVGKALPIYVGKFCVNKSNILKAHWVDLNANYSMYMASNKYVYK